MRRMFPAALTMLALTLLVSTGCTNRKAPVKVAKTAVHDHPETGPHGGALAEWGEEEFHPEFKVDHAKKEATVYINDDKAAKPAPIAVEVVELILTHVKPPITIVLKADPESTDPKGKSSRFRGTHDELAKEIEFKGEINAKIGTKPYTGTFVEKDEHDHKKK
jgi:hypothetical protein